MTSLLLLKDLIEGVSPPADGRLALVTPVLLGGAPPAPELEAGPPTRGGGDDRVGGDAEGAGGAGGGEDGGRAAPQLPEAGALLQASCSSSSTEPSALTLQGVEPGWREEGLGAVQAP